MRTGRRSAQRRALGGHIASRVLRAGELRVALTAGLLLAQPLFVDALQDLADRAPKKTRAMPESAPASRVQQAFPAVGRTFCATRPARAPARFRAIGRSLLRRALIQRMLLQFTDDPARAKTRRAPMHQAFRETRIRQPVFGFERIEHGVERIGFFDERFQLARQFRAAVFAAG